MYIDWKGITIHHSLTRDSGALSWGAIKDYHVNVNGWQDIGYHFGVELLGSQVKVMAGRPLTMQGAHCKGLNSTHIGVCVVGNYDLIEPSTQHIDTLFNLCSGLMQIYNISPYEITYHSDFAPKSCPGRLFPRKLLDYRLRTR